MSKIACYGCSLKYFLLIEATITDNKLESRECMYCNFLKDKGTFCQHVPFLWIDLFKYKIESLTVV